MNLGNSISRIYEITGVYDIIIGLPLMFIPSVIFSLFRIETPSNSPFVMVTGSGLFVIGALLVHYADRAKSNQAIGYASVVIRLHYVVSIAWNLVLTTYHPLFLVFLLTDLLTGIVLLIALLQLNR